VKVLACNKDVNPSCVDLKDQKAFFSKFHFTLYTLVGRAEHHKDPNRESVTTKSIFHSQFMLNLDQYRDNNNFMRINTVEVQKNRWLGTFLAARVYKFLDYTINPVWIGFSNDWTQFVSRNGIDFKPENQKMIFGSYFFLSDETILHTMKAYDVLSILSDFGGIVEIFIFIFSTFCFRYNAQNLLIKSIRAVYFEKEKNKRSEKFNGHNLKPIKLSFRQTVLWRLKKLVCWH
jgi:hypothetical protein